MVQMAGKYVHEKNENLDEYFKVVGVPYIPRKMMLTSRPAMEIAISEDGLYTIKTSTLLRTAEIKFKNGEEYEEHMPGGTLKSKTTVEDNKLVTESTSPDGSSKIFRIYEFDDTHCVITYKHEASGIEAKRYFKRE